MGFGKLWKGKGSGYLDKGIPEANHILGSMTFL